MTQNAMISLYLIVVMLVSTCMTHAHEQQSTHGSIRGVSVETWVSWMSALQPEVHVLITNRTETERNVALTLFFPSKKIECAGDLVDAYWSYNALGSRLGGFHQQGSKGIVPAHGWVHRSYPLWIVGLIPPCRVPFVVTLSNGGREAIEGMITVEGEPQYVDYYGEVSERSLSTEVMVEENLVRRGLVMRMLVKNEGEKAVRVAVSSRGIECSSYEKVRWALHGGPVLGESAGPAVVRGGERAAFVAAIEAPKGADLSECTGWNLLSVESKPGAWEDIKRVEFSLQPTGRYARLIEGRGVIEKRR